MSAGADALRWQFRLTWSLADTEHLPMLTDAACHWLPAPRSWTVHRGPDGNWRPDFSDDDPGVPPSIAWLSWHLIWWWGDALAMLRGGPARERESVFWPGDAAAAVAGLRELAAAWGVLLDDLAGQATGEQLDRPVRVIADGPEWPLATALAWANAELMKNVAELGYARMLYTAAHATGTSG